MDQPAAAQEAQSSIFKIVEGQSGATGVPFVTDEYLVRSKMVVAVPIAVVELKISMVAAVADAQK